MDRQQALKEITQILCLYTAEMAREDGNDDQKLKGTLRHYLSLAKALEIEKGFLDGMKFLFFNVEYILNELP